MDKPARLYRDEAGAADAAMRQAIAGFGRRPHTVALRCGVQHYEWGDTRYIPALIGARNTQERPFAELWIGAHPDRPAAAVVAGTHVPLDRLIDAHPLTVLGPRHGGGGRPRLSFLLKVLAARQPLSIQVHPNRRQAEAGFDRESALGLRPGDPRRNYRDRNHKPELLVALTDFFALRGFRPLPRIAQTLSETPELRAFADDFEQSAEGLARLYRQLMRLEQPRVNALLDPLIARLAAAHAATPFAMDDRRYWLLHADAAFSTPGKRDRGLLSILLLNLVHLRPGQGIYLAAGELHSYLRGAGIEVMANSNNVLRGGLTPKRIDVEELLRVVRFEAGPPAIVEVDSDSDTGSYRVPATEFLLERRRIARGDMLRLDLGCVALGLVTRGALTASAATAGGKPLHLGRGHCFLVPAACSGQFRCSADAEVYLAREPLG